MQWGFYDVRAEDYYGMDIEGAVPEYEDLLKMEHEAAKSRVEEYNRAVRERVWKTI